MKILFVVKSKAIETLGPMYLASVAKKRGWETQIVDMYEAFAVYNSWHPDVVGYSVMTGDQGRMEDLNRRIRKDVPSGKTRSIFGGPHVTFFQDDYEDAPFVDELFHGEAETTLDTFLGGDTDYSDINSIPWPDRKDFRGHKIRDFITSRGCPYNCSYCYNDQWSKIHPGVRVRDVKDVVNEVLSVAPDFVYFQDSCFGVNMQWLHEFAIKYNRFVNIPYHCHLRPAQVTQERVLCLKDSKCASVRIALETASPRLLKMLNRERTDLLQVADAVRLLKKWEIKLMIQNMIGLPTGTIEEDLQTLEFNIRVKPNYAWCSIFQPYPGTELGDLCKKEQWYTSDYSEITDCFFDGSVLNFSDEYKEQLKCLQKIFALAVDCGVMPQAGELHMDYFPKLVHRLTRAKGDRQLYMGVI